MLYTDRPTDDGKPATEEADIVREAAELWRAVKDWQDMSDQRAVDDFQFANGDPLNHWQYPDHIWNYRTGSDRNLPCLTINKVRVHNDLVINAMTKNGFSIKVRPTAGKASYKSAELMETLIRRIQAISRFSTHHRKAIEHQVDGGIGYILIETKYVSERSFNQDIFLTAAQDPTAVYLDPWIKEPDGSDARFGILFDRMPRKEFNRKYPDFRNKVSKAPLDAVLVDWANEKEVVVAKYYRRIEKKDTLVAFKPQGSDDEVEKLLSEIRKESGKEIADALIEEIQAGTLDGKTRPVTDHSIEWFLIAGDKIVEKGKWAGKYVPICRCVGRETVIQRVLDRKGHTRAMRSAQEMLNYAASTDVQITALQPRSPWLASARAVEGQEQWKTANVEDYAVLIYNDVDDSAPVEMQKIDPPQRIDPPRGNQGYQLAMENADKQIMMVSGQFQAQLGQNDQQSAASGKAIGERQQQADTATYHFAEHNADMLRNIGTQLIDLIPKIYDTRRALHCIGTDGEKYWMRIDPDQADVVQELKQEKDDEEAAKLAFNPKLGEYECVSDPGPDFATQRQEAWSAISMILQNNKELAAVCADLLFKYGDFPGADKLMERLQKEIKATKPYLFDDDMDPALMAAQEQAKRLTALNAELMVKLADANLKIRGRDEKRDIEASHAETDRLKVQLEYLTRVLLSPKDRAMMEHEIQSKFHDASMQMIVDANAADIAAQNAPEPASTP